ncbi:transcriptional activator RfaH [Rhodoplanes elegans]|uniref:Transcriptional activator RfaH n=1 Tax=Rhodoplanes elegans TaxID=29408 RepID=A0A327K069_9BRAD|nr:transcriptional activator RfaH [Rhodoplanes elegans]MBK5960184.1 transcriptional activator RfaH [Rhodoplanes elegans]RAI31244.1 transcriptional activator RfaH [Rhodoplanes elegans]
MLDRTSNVFAESSTHYECSTWIVVNTHPHKERIAAENLLNQSYTTYCPVIRAQVRHARKTTEVRRPLFPGYLFVALDPLRERWRPILSTLGIRTIVRNGEVPSRMDGRFIASLRAREVDGAIVKPTQPYVIGQNVKIAGGAFDGLAAKVIAMNEKDRVVVLLDLLNRTVKTHLTADQLRSA